MLAVGSFGQEDHGRRKRQKDRFMAGRFTAGGFTAGNLPEKDCDRMVEVYVIC
jgi:hypothetical protein